MDFARDRFPSSSPFGPGRVGPALRRPPRDVRVLNHTPYPLAITATTVAGELDTVAVEECGCEECAGACGVPWPCFRSIWDVYGLRRRPRRS